MEHEQLNTTPNCTAFHDGRLFASGPISEVALALKRDSEPGVTSQVLVFDDETGRAIDLDLRGSDAEILRRLAPPAADKAGQPTAGKNAGRPKLGVVPREVTLLPRHWEWLAAQPGGASATLRRLVENARGASKSQDRARHAQAAADRFMMAMLGNQQGYEEASRYLYAANASRFRELTEPWPADLRDYARRLAAPAFAEDDQPAAIG